MYNDFEENEKFLKERKVFSSSQKRYHFYHESNKTIVSTEPLSNDNHYDFKTLNCVVDNNLIFDELRQNGYAILDNFLREEYVLRLKEFVYTLNNRDDVYHSYGAILLNDKKFWFPLLTSITSEICERIEVFNNTKFVNGWAFIHDNYQTFGVTPHTDDADISINFWVTPDECIENNSKEFNGLVITDAFSKIDFENNPKQSFIDYKFNRAIIFNSKRIHYSLPCRFKEGYEHRRINYTFLFDKIR